jgi:hypothetical protein
VELIPELRNSAAWNHSEGREETSEKEDDERPRKASHAGWPVLKGFSYWCGGCRIDVYVLRALVRWENGVMQWL